MEHLSKSVRKKSSHNLSDNVYLRIKADIFDFKLLPGERFTETECTTLYQVSRTPIRQALLKLQQEGFVELASKVGWQVRPLNLRYYQELYDVRILLEREAVRLLCQQDSSKNQQLSYLRSIWMIPSEEFLTDFKEVARHDEEFHNILILATGNQEMARIHLEITEKIRIIRRLDFTKPDRIKMTYFEHQKILDLIFSNMLDEALAAITAHIEQSRDEVQKITLKMLSNSQFV